MTETSIIIRTFNEEKYLPALFASIERQAYRDFDVVVVDSGSYDRTREIAHEHGARLLEIASHDFTFGYSLNVGIRAATGRFAAIISAHTQALGDHWLASLIAPLAQDDVAMVYGRQVGAAQSNFGEARDFLRVFGGKKEILAPPRFFANNANSAIRRDLWERHPFDEGLSGLEDIAWAKRWMERGYKVVYEPEAAIVHIHESTPRQFRQRYYREAVAAKAIGIKSTRDIVPEVLREGIHLVQDVASAARHPDPLRQAKEMVRFRFNKSLGTAIGLLDGKLMEDSREREKLFFDRTSKAVVIHGPGQARLEDVVVPPIKPGEVLVRTAYVGVCGTDLEILERRLGYYEKGMAKYPIVPGHEFSGVVAEVGPNVKHVAVGDPVVVECIQSCGGCGHCKSGNWIACAERKELGVIGLNGAYAEYVAAPGRFVHKLPANVDMHRAALCEPIAVVLKGLTRLDRAIGGDRSQACLVIGGGPIGYLSASILAHRGYPVAVYDQNVRRRGYLERGLVETLATLQGLERFNVFVEATGDPGALDAVVEKSRAGATILLLGLPYSRREFNFESIVAYDKMIIGSVGSSAAEFEEAIRLLPELPLEPLTQRDLPLHEFEQAWKLFKQRDCLKILLKVT